MENGRRRGAFELPFIGEVVSKVVAPMFGF
jgi:hypothetical protein